MTYLELIRDAEHKLESNKITLGEYDELIEPLRREIEQEPCESCISRENTLKAMIEQLGIRNEDYLLPAEATLYKVVKNMPPVQPKPKTGHLSNKDWVDLLTEQFNVSRTSAKEMLHAMMSVKKEDNFKKQFSGGCNVSNNSKR